MTQSSIRPTEEQEAFFLASWLELNKVFFIHVPNEGKRSRWQGQRLKRMGMRPGACDFLIFDPPPAYPGYKGVAIELKRVGEKPRENQYQFLEEMAKRSWKVFWSEGGEEAARQLEVLGYCRRVR